MRQRQRLLLTLASLALSGCLFGSSSGGDDDDIVVNNATSNNTASNNTASNNNAMTEETYAPLTTRARDCDAPTTFWFAPEASDEVPPLTDRSVISTAAAPKINLVSSAGEHSLAYATPSGGQVQVFAAAVEPTDASMRLVPAKHNGEPVRAGAVIDTDAEVLATYLSVGSLQADGEVLFTVTVVTGAGFWDCRKPVGGPMTCDQSDKAALVDQLGITSPARVDFAPQLERFGAEDEYLLPAASGDVYALISGPAEQGEDRIGLLRTPYEGGTADLIELESAIGTTTDGSEPFLERFAFGTDEVANGSPLVLALARDPQGEHYKPRVLMRLGGADTYREDDTRGEWRLSSRVSSEPGLFSFVDAYDVEARFVLSPLGVAFPPGPVRLGYVGLHDEGLVFSRPGGFANDDFLEHPLLDAKELFVAKNIQVQSESPARPLIVVVHGPDRDQLLLMEWDVSLEATHIVDALADGFGGARQITAAGWFADGKGTLGMLAQDEEQTVLAVVPVDVSDLTAHCR